MKQVRNFFLTLCLLAETATADVIHSSIDPSLLLEVKLTPQMKYLTSQDAYSLLSADPNIFFVDVRDPVEVKLTGHPSMIDAVIPVRAQSNIFDEELKEWALKDNPDFLMYMEQALATFGKSRHDMIIITCGSGWRSAHAARLLHDAGYTDVWHIPDGYVGEEKRGLNLANAWQLEGLPWSYETVYGSQKLRIIH